MKILLIGITFLASMSVFATDCSVYVRGGLNFGKDGNKEITKALKKKDYIVSSNHSSSRFQLNRKILNDVTMSTSTCDGADKRDRGLTYKVGLVERSSELYRIGNGESERTMFSCAKRSKAISRAISQLPGCNNF